jgi:MFS family permease
VHETDSERAEVFHAQFVRLLVAQLGFSWAYAGLFLVPKFFQQALAASTAEIGLAAGVYGAAMLVAMPVAGVLADRIGRKPLLLSGAVVSFISIVGFLFLGSFGPSAYGLRALQGVGIGLSMVAGSTMAGDMIPKARMSQGLGLFGSVSVALSALAPAGVELVQGRYGWDVAIGSIACGALFFLLMGLRVTETQAAMRRSDDDSARSLWALIVIKGRPVVLLVGAAVGVTFGTLMTYEPLYALSLGHTNVRSFFIGYAACAFGFRILAGRGPDRWGRRRVALASVLAYGMSAMLMGTVAENLGFWAIGGLLGASHGAFFPALNGIVLEEVEGAERGKVTSLFHGAFSFGMGAGAAGMGGFVERYGFPQAFMAAGVVALGAVGLLLAVRPDGDYALLEASAAEPRTARDGF